MKRGLYFLVMLCCVSCADKPHPENEPEVLTEQEAPAMSVPTMMGAPIPFPQIEDNLAHDTLLIQITFDLQDGTFMMVASNTRAEEQLDAGDRNAGLRLYHYRLGKDGSPEMLARSSSALDSWTMFPTFFADPKNEGSYIILANLGERNSWGQKVIRFNDQGYNDLGFLNVAALKAREDDEEGQLRSITIAPHARVGAEGDALLFTFELDELLLYDDLRGGVDRTIQASRVSYRYNEAEGMVLYIDGEARHEEQAS